MMSRVKKGIIAGLAATIVVSVLEAVNVFFGPWVTPFPSIVAYMMGMSGALAIGWVAHFIAGTLLLGAAFGVVYPKLPTDTPETKGILFAVAAWVLMMLFITFAGDARMFRGESGMVIAWMLATHMVFGVVLGNVYARLSARERRAATIIGGAPAH